MLKLTKNLMTLAFVLSSAIALNAAADDTGTTPPTGKHHHHRGFFLGMCVGQKLATATPPVILQPGKRDPTVQAAIKAAKQECKAAFKAAKASKSNS